MPKHFSFVAAAAAAAAAAAFCFNLTTSNAVELLGYYEFEDNYNDSSGKDNTAEESQNPDELSFAAGFRGQAVDINDPDSSNNTGGSIDLPIDVNPFELPGVTFGGWLNVEEFEFDGFMAIDNGGWDRGITVNARGSNSFGIASGSGPTNLGEIVPGEWQFVVGSFDSEEDTSTLYVGNANANTQTTESASGSDTTAEGLLVIEIGRYDNQDLDGLVDDVFVFDEALDAHQVNAIRNLRLSNANYSPLLVGQLFNLFEDGEAGEIGVTTWTPISGLDTENPGAIFDLGDDAVAIVLDDAGNGMVGDDEAFVPTDSDGDGLEDLWETVNFGNLERDGTGDFDEDAFTDLEEFDKGTNPKKSDTDGDGLVDGDEVKTHNTNPLESDTDGDTWDDGAELAFDPPSDPTDPTDFPRPPVVALPLLGFYEFEDNYNDSSGLGNDAMPEQNPEEISFVDGFRGKSADINDPDPSNNTGGSINIPIDANPGELPEVSFGGWVNVDPESIEGGEFDGFMAIDNGGWDRGITVNYQASESFGIASGAGPGQESVITAGEWQYVLGTFNDEEDRAILYVGDATTDQTTVTIEVPDSGDSPGEVEIEIGRYDNQDLDGIVDDIFVFGGELDAHQANAIRNLRLSGLDVSPLGAAQIFELYENEESGSVGGIGWTPTSGLDASPPGAVVEDGGAVSVVLSDTGDGMKTGNSVPFQITAFVINTEGETLSVTLTWDSRAGKTYALEAAPDLIGWLEIDDGIEATGKETSFTDTSPEVTTDEVRYYRVREVQG